MLKNTVVIDLDGTLANVEHRRELVACAKPKWDEFYASCDKDELNEWCSILMASMHEAGYKVVIVSARRQECRKKTLKWLAENGVVYSQLILLRPPDDNIPDTQLKRDWLHAYGKNKILFVVDDRQKVVDMWREEGMTCLQCDAWKEFKASK